MYSLFRRLLLAVVPLAVVALTDADEWAARASALSPPWRETVLPVAERWAVLAPHGAVVDAWRPRDSAPLPSAPSVPPQTPQAPLAAALLPSPSQQSVPAVVQPAASETPSALPPPAVLITVGDSLMAFVALGLRRGLPEARITDVSRASTGLSNAPFYDWPSAAARAVEASKATWLVVHMGANDAQAVKTPTGWVPFGSKGWDEAYALRARLLVEEAEKAAPGLEVIWLTMPAMRDRDFDKRMERVTAAQQTVCSLPHVHCIEGRAALGPDYQKTGRTASGRLRLWRADDGVHYSAEGGWRLASAIGTALSWNWPAAERGGVR